MTAKLESKKTVKENALMDAAFDLFTKAGVNSTTIDEIVKKAGVAKGTFYLYFKDKYDILDMIIIRITSGLLREAIMVTKTRIFDNRIDEVICFTDYLIEHLAQDKLKMRIIHKNLSYSLYQKVINDPVRGVELKKIVEEFKKGVMCDGYSGQETDELLFILLEMTGSVCYSSIINDEPAPIDAIKPVLLKAIRKILA
jgi:AcrR family transcriptional regulator